MSEQILPPPAAAMQDETRLTTPPGFAGILATSLLHNAYTPVPEFASVASLGLLAGIVGRAYRTPTGKDLSLYINLVADSGMGKDVIHEGIPELLRYSDVLMADRLIKQEAFSHGVTLHKAILRDPGFLALQPEWGRTLKRMISGDTNAESIRDMLTRLYAKDYFGGIEYSKAENSLPGVRFPALTWLGETTPATFLESLTAEMMEDGFMSRFLTVWYEGKRLYPNEERFLHLEPKEKDYWKCLVAYCLQWALPGSMAMPDPVPVGFADDEDERRFKSFEHQCIDQINATSDPYLKQAFNRAHMKALKIASILAVADNYTKPLIKCQHAAWARSLVNADIASFEKRNASGDVGTGDHTREQKLLAVMKDYLVNGAADSYKIPPAMRQAGIVPRAYLQIRTQRKPQFTSHKLGATAGLDLALRSLIDSGYIAERDKRQVMEAHSFHGKAYVILRLP